LRGLLAIHAYRFLSINQFAKASDLKPSFVRDLLRDYERRHVLGSIGNVGIKGVGKTPKLYYLTRKGYGVLLEASGLRDDELGAFVPAHTNTRWSPAMYHRMATVDLMLAMESSLSVTSHLRLVDSRIEYRRVKRGRGVVPETSDFVALPEAAGNRIVPDAAFVFEKTLTGARALFFLETDMGTERITRGTKTGYSIIDKMRQYERYLTGGRFADTYRVWGDFKFFTLLFVTNSPERVQNIRRAVSALDPKLHAYFQLTTFESVQNDFLGANWYSRDPRSAAPSSIVRGT